MYFDYTKFKAEVYQPFKDSSFTELYIAYKNEEASNLLRKLNFLDEFKEIVTNNNGIFNESDSFDNEEDIQAAIFELKEIFKDENFSKFLIKDAIIEYIAKKNFDISNPKHLNNIYKYFDVLGKDYINFLLLDVK